MKFLGISLRDIHLKREDMTGELMIKNIKNNINIVDVKIRDLSPDSADKAIIFSFEYKTDYDLSKPKDASLGSIYFLGDVVFTDGKKEMDAVVKAWKKNKKIDEKIIIPVLQAALNHVNVEAIYLSRKVMLPSPVKLPQIKQSQEE